MARKRHIDFCRAPICVADNVDGWKKNRIWYPGERVCDKRPLTKVQKLQKKLNELKKKKRLKFPNRYFTYKSLDRREDVGELTRGFDPEIRG